MTRRPHHVDQRQPRRPRQTSGPGYTHGYIAGRAAARADRAANRAANRRRRDRTITVLCLLAVLCLTLLVVTR
jgi:hypothetical protein